MTTKLVVVALIVIVGLFVATLLMSASHGSQQTDSPGPASSLKGLQGSRFLKLGDKASATCAVPGQTSFTVNFSCTIVLAKRSIVSSPTRITLLPSVPLTVDTDPTSGPKQHADVGAFDCFGTAVDHSGGTLTLTANGTVTILSRSC